jgi:hypothetical protein
MPSLRMSTNLEAANSSDMKFDAASAVAECPGPRTCSHFSPGRGSFGRKVDLGQRRVLVAHLCLHLRTGPEYSK